MKAMQGVASKPKPDNESSDSDTDTDDSGRKARAKKSSGGKDDPRKPKANQKKGTSKAGDEDDKKPKAKAQPGPSRGKTLPTSKRAKSQSPPSKNPTAKKLKPLIPQVPVQSGFFNIIQKQREWREKSARDREARSHSVFDEADDTLQGLRGRDLTILLEGLTGKALKDKRKDVKQKYRKEKERRWKAESDKKQAVLDAKHAEKVARNKKRGSSGEVASKAMAEHYSERTAEMLANPEEYDDVEEDDVKEVCQLMYVPPEHEITRGYFVAKNYKGERQNVEPAWVKDVFDKVIVQDIMWRPRTFVDVPIGTRPKSQETVSSPGGPVIRFRQHDNKTCVFKSMACALHYLDKHNAANALSTLAVHTERKHGKGLINYLYETMEAHVPEIADGQKWNTSKKLEKFDVMANISKYPTLLQLLGTDGGIQHAVTTVDNWIFDSAEEYALALTLENLNKCCGPNVGLDKIWAAYRFEKKGRVSIGI